MKKNIYIVGCGGQAKVSYDIIKKLEEYKNIYFVDKDDGIFLGCDVINENKFLEKYEEENIFLALGENSVRKKVHEKYKLKNHKFPNIIHPSATISKNVKFGYGNIVMANSVINTHSNIKNFCVLNTASILEHDCDVSSYVSLAPNSVICGNCTIGEGVYIGANACVIHSINIKKWSVIGASSTVIKDICENTVNVGTPTVRIKKIDEDYKVL